MDERDLVRGALQATGVVKKGVQLKAGVIALALFLVALIGMGMLFPGGSAQASSCEDTGPGTADAAPASGTSSGQATGTLHQQQLRYAKTIDSVAKKNGLPGRATLIALMTAMQESTLQNLDHGDQDSVGLFQQRPSMGWGTKAQITDPKTGPAFATTSFFEGRGGNTGLVDVKNWQTLPLGTAAQKVQKSAHPELYAGHESAMRSLAKEAGIDLERSGTSSSSGTTTDTTTSSTEPVTSQNTSCAAAGSGSDTTTGGASSGKFTDGKQTWTLHNPRSVAEAIQWAKNHAGANSTSDWYRRCLAFTANVYGWSFSGVNYAIDHYKVVPASMRHDGDRHPPPGALMYWDTGHRAGHIAVYLGDGKIASNDILRPGYIDVVDAGLIESKWGSKYIGWTPPYFPKAG
ncbi:peptidase M23 [Streptomyces sp. bgisy153]|uniref:peptidase M23 n=1 Tax=Streptomyces sp. bgisy153 TaxID=3413793 RepID=UPI003D73885D